LRRWISTWRRIPPWGRITPWWWISRVRNCSITSLK